MFTTTLLLSHLALNDPATPPDSFANRLDHAELLANGDHDVQLVAYDHAGEVIGTIALWVDERGAHHLESDYDDGYASTVVIDGRDRTMSTLSGEVIAARAQAITDIMVAPQAGKLWCATKIAGAAALCAPLVAGNALGVFSCPAGIIWAWCECAPVLGIDDGGVCEEQ
jgi:hypothetical protein